MPVELFQHLPQQWVGLFAVLAFGTYILAQLAEKFQGVAKLLPFGRWWHKRQQKKIGRRAWVAEDNEVIQALQEQVSSIAGELADVRETLRSLTAFTVYDARWHHRVEVTNARSETCLLPEHLDYFAFDRLWRNDPVAAAKLPA
ncbi:minor tail protein [Mycobacterium phage Cindaradix]|uniref:Minor tail protein n=1 Tax=Mycobacterium phage Cindaradix TaxID=2041524 RepID=A0A2D1G8J8_9CAUD|nr:minor tail protein [Mycobacterium phage Cindaradix]ATN88103.1 minor tail protein [Mycobacterium phage Cindaradix]